MVTILAVLAGGGELVSTKGASLGFFRCALFIDRKKKYSPVVKFIVPDWGIKLTPALGLSYRPARLHIGWQASTTTLCRSQPYPPFRDCEFGYADLQKEEIRQSFPFEEGKEEEEEDEEERVGRFRITLLSFSPSIIRFLASSSSRRASLASPSVFLVAVGGGRLDVSVFVCVVSSGSAPDNKNSTFKQ